MRRLLILLAASAPAGFVGADDTGKHGMHQKIVTKWSKFWKYGYNWTIMVKYSENGQKNG